MMNLRGIKLELQKQGECIIVVQNVGNKDVDKRKIVFKGNLKVIVQRIQ